MDGDKILVSSSSSNTSAQCNEANINTFIQTVLEIGISIAS